MEVFSTCLNQNNDDYEKLWSSLGSIAKAHNASLPEKSSSLAWRKAIDKYDGTSLSGNLKYSSKAETPIFEFSLNPLRSERSYRLSRQFGGDRFFAIEMPGISTESFPAYLKSYAMALREDIIGWLVNTEHRFLGRTWRAFYVKPEPRKNRGSAKGSIDSKFRVYFFASESNNDFDDFVKWFLPFKHNLNQPCLKFFARLGLGAYAVFCFLDES